MSAAEIHFSDQENAIRWYHPIRYMLFASEDAMTADEEFTAQCERQLKRALDDRIRFGFFRNPEPVRDRGTNRSFSSMEEYRRFCEERYPEHFGYGRAPPLNPPQP